MYDTDDLLHREGVINGGQRKNGKTTIHINIINRVNPRCNRRLVFF